MMMNKNISTPYDCAKHISESIVKMSVIALRDGKVWDMHRPLTSNCELQLAVADSALKDNVNGHLHSFPVPIIHSGSFTYDVFINLADWRPTDSELRAMFALFVKLVNQELLLEKLEVPCSVALNIFQDNPFKLEQIPNIAKDSGDDSVTLYRLGDYVDISKGPMVNNSGLVGRVSILAVHRLVDESMDGLVNNLYCFQGLALPKGILLNHFAYSVLENHAKKLNTITWQPHMEDIATAIISEQKTKIVGLTI